MRNVRERMFVGGLSKRAGSEYSFPGSRLGTPCTRGSASMDVRTVGNEQSNIRRQESGNKLAPNKAGHSLIEMLVVLIVVGILIAVVVPAIQRARESARMGDCINRQAQLAKAVHMHVTDDPYGRFPGYRAFGSDGTTVVGYAPQLFEYLGRSDLPANPAEPSYIDALVCPSNQGPKDMPRLNYVVNGGQAGTDSPADGIFYDHAKDEKVYITKDDFRDGLTNTILLAENLDATRWDDTLEASQCILWPLTEGNEINSGSGSRPSSHHPGGFVAAFADGSVKFMNEVDINDDDAVHTDASFYVVLLTPGGDYDYPTTVDGVDPCDQPEAQPEVNIGLDWIAAHQSSDGSWSLNHNTHPDCNGSCGNNGTLADNRIAATGLALLPLLGFWKRAGQRTVCTEYLSRHGVSHGSPRRGRQSRGRLRRAVHVSASRRAHRSERSTRPFDRRPDSRRLRQLRQFGGRLLA